jgi:hypothetical protein
MFLVSAIGTACALTPVRCDELNGLGFEKTTDKTMYRVGEPIRVSVTWTNVGPVNTKIPSWRGPTEGVSSTVEGKNTIYDFAVYYEGGERISFHGVFSNVTAMEVSLEPKQSLTSSYEIDGVYSFARPGRYALRTIDFGYGPDDHVAEHWRGRIMYPDVAIWIRE